ncbi:FHA domain-containing protein [Thermodesulfobacteriota bacterium]
MSPDEKTAIFDKAPAEDEHFKKGSWVRVEVIGSPMDGLCYEGGSQKISIARHGANITLSRDSGVSRNHSQLRFEEECWWLLDVGSRNGTFHHNADIRDRKSGEGRIEIHTGAIFVVGCTALEFISHQKATDSGQPQEESLSIKEILGRLSAQTDTVVKEAQKKTRDLGWNTVGGEHLFDALCSIGDPLIEKEINGLGLKTGTLLKELWGMDYWGQEYAWVAERMKRGEFIRQSGYSPRALRVLNDACKLAADSGQGPVEPAHLFKAIVEDRKGPVGRLLLNYTERADQAEEKKDIPQHSSHRTPSVAGIQVPEPAPRAEIDHTAWIIARELSDRIMAVQIEFHLAEAKERREALSKVIRSFIDEVAPERRKLVLCYLMAMFPTNEAIQYESDEIEQLRDEIHKLKASQKEKHTTRLHKTANMEMPSIEKLRKLVEDGKATPAQLTVQHLCEFVAQVENIIIGFLKPIDQSYKKYLPKRSVDFEAILSKLEEKDEIETIESLAGYLDELKLWFTAILSAYKKAGSGWCEDFWDKINPRALERKVQRSGGFKAIPYLREATLWKEYETLVRDVTRDLVMDMINDAARKNIPHEFSFLKRSSK